MIKSKYKFIVFFCLCSFLFLSNALADIFYTWDLGVMPPATINVSAPLALSDGALEIFLDERASTNENFDETLIPTLTDGLLYSTPELSTNPDLGILPILISMFDNLPENPGGKPSNGKFAVLLTPMRNFRNTGFDGFFRFFDQMTPSEASEYNEFSNQKNMVYINTLRNWNQSDLLGIISHELTHLLTAYLPEKSVWLSELIGEGAMLATGYTTDQGLLSRFVAHPARPLLCTNKHLSYGALSLFVDYLFSKYEVPNQFLYELSHIQQNPTDPSDISRLETVMGSDIKSILTDFLNYWLSFQNKHTKYFFIPASPKTPIATGTHSFNTRTFSTSFFSLPDYCTSVTITTDSNASFIWAKVDNEIAIMYLGPGAPILEDDDTVNKQYYFSFNLTCQGEQKN